MTPAKFLSIPTKFLTQSISAASAAFKVNNIQSWALNSLGQNINLTSADFGTRAWCVFRNDSGSTIEIMEFDPTTIASFSITILKRGLGFSGDLTTETTDYKLDWPAGSIVQFGTDVPQLLATVPTITTAVVAPAVTPTKVGDIYVDTVLAKVYIAAGTSASSDWKLLN